MVINSTNIINTNNHLSPNNHLSFLLNTKKTTTYDVGNPGLDFGQVQICGGVKPVNEWIEEFEDSKWVIRFRK